MHFVPHGLLQTIPPSSPPRPFFLFPPLFPTQPHLEGVGSKRAGWRRRRRCTSFIFASVADGPPSPPPPPPMPALEQRERGLESAIRNECPAKK